MMHTLYIRTHLECIQTVKEETLTSTPPRTKGGEWPGRQTHGIVIPCHETFITGGREKVFIFLWKGEGERGLPGNCKYKLEVFP